MRNTGYNSSYPKVAVQWLNQTLYFYQSLCLADSEELQNPRLLIAAKRYASIQVQCRLTVLCSEARPNAKPKTVSSQFRERHQNNKMKLKIWQH